MYLSIYLSMYLSIYLSIYLLIYLFVCPVDLPQFAVFSVSISAVTSEGIGPYSDVISNKTFEGCKLFFTH